MHLFPNPLNTNRTSLSSDFARSRLLNFPRLSAPCGTKHFACLVITILSMGINSMALMAAPIQIETVLVGDAGNANDSTGYGAVSYEYHIGKYPVTNAQYTTFLNAVAASDPHGLWNSSMGTNVHGGISRSGSNGSYMYDVRSATEGFNEGQSMADMPVNYVSFWSAARFANWLTTGDTETGVYDLGGVTNPSNSTITRDETAWTNGGVAITSENEWYKAAYYDPTLDGGAGGYWLFPTRSNTAPISMGPNNTDTNSANYTINGPNTVTPVGGYELASSHYGTFDQGGNVWEWNDEIVSDSFRRWRGGSFNFAHFASYLGSET